MKAEKTDTELILRRVTEKIVDQLSVSEKDIRLNSHYINDLGADSLDTVELMMALEDEFKEINLKIPDDEAEKLSTVQDTINYIESFIMNNQK
ncbi:MAG: acyl carrier protein [Candidatus Sericytochromatia bacterium]